jgi:hypothetical protein
LSTRGRAFPSSLADFTLALPSCAFHALADTVPSPTSLALALVLTLAATWACEPVRAMSEGGARQLGEDGADVGGSTAIVRVVQLEMSLARMNPGGKQARGRRLRGRRMMRAKASCARCSNDARGGSLLAWHCGQEAAIRRTKSQVSRSRRPRDEQS